MRAIRIEKFFARSILKQNHRWCSMRNELALIEVTVFRDESIDLLRPHLLSEFLKILSVLRNFIGRRSRHQRECLEAAIETTQQCAHSRITAMSDEGDSLRVDIPARS